MVVFSLRIDFLTNHEYFIVLNVNYDSQLDHDFINFLIDLMGPDLHYPEFKNPFLEYLIIVFKVLL